MKIKSDISEEDYLVSIKLLTALATTVRGAEHLFNQKILDHLKKVKMFGEEAMKDIDEYSQYKGWTVNRRTHVLWMRTLYFVK